MSTLKKFLFSFLIAAAVVCAAFLPAQKVGATPAAKWHAHGYPVSNWTTDNGTVHQVGFVNDPKHKCFRMLVDMSPNIKENTDYDGNNYTMQPSGYDILINGNHYSLTLNTIGVQNGQVGGDVWDPKHNKDVRQKNICHVHTDKKSHQSAYVTIPYSMFNEEDLNAASTITFTNRNLSNTSITISGASTGPWLLAAAAVLIAAPAVAVATHKQRKGVAHER